LNRYAKQVVQNEAKLGKLGLGLHGGQAHGKHGAKRFQKNKHMACRATGGGRKQLLAPMYNGVKSWFEQERMMGRFVDRGDLFLEVEERVKQCQQHLQLKATSAVEPLTLDERKMLKACEQFLDTTHLEHPRRIQNKEFRKDQILSWSRAKLLKPQRLTMLSSEQEKWRCEQTWRLADSRMSMIAFGTESELGEHVGQPQKFCEHRKATVIIQSDQVPFYVKVRPNKQLYAAHETRAAGSKSVLSDWDKQKGLSGGHSALKLNEDGELPSMTQLRGAEHSKSDKYRVTIELVHLVHNWFESEDKRPLGSQGRHLLVLPGGHGDLSNIDNQHRFIETRRFWVGDKPKLHEQGAYTNILRSLVELRRDSEQVRHMLSRFHVMSQPAGFVDSVIFAWHMALQSEEYPTALSIRDLFTGAFSASSKQATSAADQVSSWIWGGMTPCLQLTDTTCAHQLKHYALQAQDKLRRELRQAALNAGVEPRFYCSHYEMLRISYESCEQLAAYMDGSIERTLRDSISNGVLAMRPCYKQGRLVPVLSQQWVIDKQKELKPTEQPWKLGNHRMQRDWYEHRYSWFDDAGKPLGAHCEQPNDMRMSDEDLAKLSLKTDDLSLEPHETVNYDEPVAEQAVLNFDDLPENEQDQQDIVAASNWLCKLSSKEQRYAASVDALLSDQTRAGAGKRALKRKVKAKARQKATGEQLKELQEALKVNTRKQLLTAIVPGGKEACVGSKIVAWVGGVGFVGGSIWFFWVLCWVVLGSICLILANLIIYFHWGECCFVPPPP
jgi:hypothetical protein